jgi:hypothetical protein
MNCKLKQPKKYVHNLLICEEQNNPTPLSKFKQIGKLKDKKVIKKSQEPSALRLAAINHTFHKIETNTNQMVAGFHFDQERLQACLNYTGKTKCRCNRNIKYYCLRCMFRNPQLELPTLHLPITVRILHHPSEKLAKSSIVPVTFLSAQVEL